MSVEPYDVQLLTPFVVPLSECLLQFLEHSSPKGNQTIRMVRKQGTEPGARIIPMRTNIVGLGDGTSAPNFQSAFVFEGQRHKTKPVF